MSYNYSQIKDKIELWKKAKAEFNFSNFQDYLLIAFSDEDSIYLNQTCKVETEKYVIFILRYNRPYETVYRTWYNNRFKVFYFTRHEYGDFFELDYIPLSNGWKLDFTFADPKVDYQDAFENLTLVNVNSQIDRIDIDFKWDYLKWDLSPQISQLIQKAFSSILRKAKSTVHISK